MNYKALFLACALLPFASNAIENSPRAKFFYRYQKEMKDIKVDCVRGNKEIEVEVLTQIGSGNNEIYKALINKTRRINEYEITVSRDGAETCRYLTKYDMRIGRKDNFEILDKVSLDGKFCEGVIGEGFPFMTSKVNPNFELHLDPVSLVDTCGAQSRKFEAVREYMRKPLGKAGPLPKELKNWWEIF